MNISAPVEIRPTNMSPFPAGKQSCRGCWWSAHLGDASTLSSHTEASSPSQFPPLALNMWASTSHMYSASVCILCSGFIASQISFSLYLLFASGLSLFGVSRSKITVFVWNPLSCLPSDSLTQYLTAFKMKKPWAVISILVWMRTDVDSEVKRESMEGTCGHTRLRTEGSGKGTCQQNLSSLDLAHRHVVFVLPVIS